MSWNDDSWKDGYDEWKLRSPYDDGPEDECDHDCYDLDILSGRASCNMCDHSWYASDGEIAEEAEHQRRYAIREDRENRRQWWRDRTYPIRRLIERFRIWRQGRAFQPSVGDDEIPF